MKKEAKAFSSDQNRKHLPIAAGAFEINNEDEQGIGKFFAASDRVEHGPSGTVWTGKIVYRMFGEMVYSFMIK